MTNDEAERGALAANSDFYAAFARRDTAAMRALWARGTPVACIHPGTSMLTGRELVLASWDAILQNPSAPRVECINPRAFHFAGGAFVTCVEVVDGGLLAATNLFVLEDGEWRIAHHQAGPIVRASAEQQTPRPPGFGSQN